MNKSKVLTEFKETSEVRRTRGQEGRLVTEDKKHGGQVGKIFNLFCNPDLRISKRIAFTLAEVLITLGIIGIVAAITIPTLVKNYQEYTFKNKWKAIYAQFNQVAKQIAYDYDSNDFSEIVNIVRDSEPTIKAFGDVHGRNDALNIIFKKYFNHLIFRYSGNGSLGSGWNCLKLLGRTTNNQGGYKYLSGIDAGTWVLGYYPTACFQVKDFNFAIDTYSNNGTFSIDVNGSEKPNIIGKDIFVINIKNLNNVKAGGDKGFYDTAEYACDKNASRGGPACSREFLK